jgi:DNA-binding PadR family transcriptional regulator
MKELSNAESALLGLISEQPMHPYQIEREVRYRDMRFWTELSMSSIYKLLRKLEKEGFVSRTNTVSPENRLRKRYSPSETGKRALKKKLRGLLSEPEHVRWRVDIGTYNSDLLPPKDVRKLLLRYRKGLEERIDGYRALMGFLKDSGCPSHRLGIASRPVFLLKGEIQWIDSILGSGGDDGKA